MARIGSYLARSAYSTSPDAVETVCGISVRHAQKSPDEDNLCAVAMTYHHFDGVCGQWARK